jgi:hypothetical protein
MKKLLMLVLASYCVSFTARADGGVGKDKGSESCDKIIADMKIAKDAAHHDSSDQPGAEKPASQPAQ